MAELELLEPDNGVTAGGQVPGRGRAERTEPDDDVVDDRCQPRSSLGSNQRRMSAESSSIGANQPCV